MAYEIYDNLETTLTAAFDPVADSTFPVPTADIPPLLYTDINKDVLFTISDGTENLFVTCYPSFESGGEVFFEVLEMQGYGAAPTTVYPIGSTVTLATSRAGIVQAGCIPMHAAATYPGMFGDPYAVVCVGSYSTAFVDQSGETTHLDIHLSNVVNPENLQLIPATRNQMSQTEVNPPRTLNIFVRQHLSGGNFDANIIVSTPTGGVTLTPSGTGPTTTEPVKCLRITAVGIPATNAWITSEWIDAQELDMSEGGGGG